MFCREKGEGEGRVYLGYRQVWQGVNGESVGMGGEDVVRIPGEREENGRGES